jgi:uncharacterized protein YbjT (DUF2867 family)
MALSGTRLDALLPLGATGATGRHLLEQALAQGHHVTALVRNPPSSTAAPRT